LKKSTRVVEEVLMRIIYDLRLAISLVAVLLASSLLGVAQTSTVAGTITSRIASVEGVKLNYLTAGQGPAVIL